MTLNMLLQGKIWTLIVAICLNVVRIEWEKKKEEENCLAPIIVQGVRKAEKYRGLIDSIENDR